MIKEALMHVMQLYREKVGGQMRLTNSRILLPISVKFDFLNILGYINFAIECNFLTEVSLSVVDYDEQLFYSFQL